MLVNLVYERGLLSLSSWSQKQLLALERFAAIVVQMLSLFLQHLAQVNLECLVSLLQSSNLHITRLAVFYS